MKRLCRGAAILASLIVLTLLTATGAASAQEPAVPVARGSDSEVGQRCATVFEKITPDKPETRVVSRRCTTGTAAQARALAPAASVELVRIYQDSYYNVDTDGDPTFGFEESFFGSSGPCDFAGYSFSNLSLINIDIGGIQSYRTYNLCNGQSLYSSANFGALCQPLQGPSFATPVLPGQCPNNLNSMRVYRLT